MHGDLRIHVREEDGEEHVRRIEDIRWGGAMYSRERK
jgi:hypothetical protein